MITLYDPRSADATGAHRWETVFHRIEQRRYEWLAQQLLDADKQGAADLCRRWADEHRLTISALDEVNARIAELDAALYPLTGSAA